MGISVRFSSALNSTIYQCEQHTKRPLSHTILNGNSAALRLADLLCGEIRHRNVGCVGSEQLTFLRQTCNCLFLFHLLVFGATMATHKALDRGLSIISPVPGKFQVYPADGLESN